MKGKTFEKQIQDAFTRTGWLAYRNVDALTGRGGSVRSLPDMWAFHSTGTVFLVEAKAVKGRSIPFTRLAEHQADVLAMFDAYGDSYHGAVVVCYYGEKPRWKRAFLLSISEWLWAENDIGRKSLPLGEAEARGIELAWQPKVGWVIPNTIQGGINDQGMEA